MFPNNQTAFGKVTNNQNTTNPFETKQPNFGPFGSFGNAQFSQTKNQFTFPFGNQQQKTENV